VEIVRAGNVLSHELFASFGNHEVKAVLNQIHHKMASAMGQGQAESKCVLCSELRPKEKRCIVVGAKQ
jgi:hypothetical protein